MSIQNQIDIDTKNLTTTTIQPLTVNTLNLPIETLSTVPLTTYTTSQFSSLTIDSTIISSFTEQIRKIKSIKFVIAGNRQEYKAFIEKRKFDSDEYIFVEEPDQLRDYNVLHGFYVGSWRERDDIKEIKDIIFSRNQRI